MEKPQTGEENTSGSILLRTPIQTAGWILARRPIIIILITLLASIIVIAGVARGAAGGGDTAGRIVAGVKTMPRAATPKPSFTGDSEENLDKNNPDSSGETTDTGEPRTPDGDENPDDNDNNSGDSENNENNQDEGEETSPTQSPTPEETPAPGGTATSEPVSPEEPASTSVSAPSVPPSPAAQQNQALVRTATASRIITCTAPSTINIEAVGTGNLTLQTSGGQGQPVTGTGRIATQATGQQIQVTAVSQSNGRAYIQFVWATLSGGYCVQNG